MREAFHVATTGRPGPVLVDMPKDVANQTMDWYWPEAVDLPGYKPTTKGHPKQIKDAARLMGEAQRPVIYAGGGILKARAAEALRELVELTGIPVVTTLMARGAFPDDHELCLGMPGMHGNYTAITAMQQSDLLIALGSRFDDRVTGKLDGFAPGAKIIHVDIDPAELGKVRRPDVPIVGDCRLVIEELVKAVRGRARTSATGPSLDDVARAAARVAGAVTRSTTSRTRTARSSRSSASTSCATTRPTTRSSRRASASTRCGRASAGSSTTRTRG